MPTTSKNVAILGASRGLGRELKLEIAKQSPSAVRFMLAARDLSQLMLLKSTEDLVLAADFTRAEDQSRLMVALHEFEPSHIFYVAGGGPYGRFETKKWPAHQWALELNFLWPAKMLHLILNNLNDYKSLQQAIFVGSAIAGQNPDPFASSYAAAKHGLRGLITSVQKEGQPIDIRIYEPGYMATDMLPANSWPRLQGLAKSPEDEARQLWQWAQSKLD